MRSMDELAAFVARHAGRKRSAATKVASLAAGFLTFLVLVPLALGAAGHVAAKYISVSLPRSAEVMAGMVFAAVGLSALAWATATFWSVGRGTPVPFASPPRLVTSGPFRYTRNPIKLGAILFYMGIGTACDGVVTGMVMLAIGLSVGTIYHKVIEEKELKLRFGREYEEYRRRTSFIIPWPPRSDEVA